MAQGVKLTIDEVKRMFEKEGYLILSDEYVNCYTKLDVLCPQGHQLKMHANHFRNGVRCHFHAKNKRESFGSLEQIVKASGYKFITTKDELELRYNSANKSTGGCLKITVECVAGHVREVRSAHFKKGKAKCRACLGMEKYSFEYVKEYIESAGYKLLSTKYVNNLSKLKVSCLAKHDYEVSFACFKLGSRCVACLNATRRDENHPSYNPLISQEEREKQRKSSACRDWTKKVYERDDYTCQKCGVRGKRMNAHHIHSYAKHADLRHDVNNGAALCVPCHKQFHKQYGACRFLPNDFYKWMSEKQTQLM